ncbi:MAG TPA: hypothetical protein VKX17_02140 [Planctomycetota bacterium]|nr:hypothetical protein [Planctomycetota bacterium]
MNNTAAASDFGTKRRYVVRQVSKLRHEIEDLMDYLDLLDARARNLGKPRLSTAAVKQRLGLK